MFLVLALGGILSTPGLHIPTNATLDRLTTTPTQALAQAAQHLKNHTLVLAETPIDANRLQLLAHPPSGESLTRWVREELGRPVDLQDFILFLDDLVVSSAQLPSTIYLPASRGRAYGILLHPQDVFSTQRRRYGSFGELPLDKPPQQRHIAPAADFSPPGPAWTARYPQPETDIGKIRELTRENPIFGRAILTLFTQLKKQGAFTWIEAGVRPRERGFLIYGSWYLSRSPSEQILRRRIRALHVDEKAWGLDIPIRWRHPDGFTATIEALRAMADTYGVDYATRRGARNSSHYGGRAVDLVAVDLPKHLNLLAPDGEHKTFDLSAREASRDLSLSPQLISWIEQHFRMRKLRKDYPHWSALSQLPSQ
ncbi:MAG: hypothetical protein KTR25_15470 [Myxococcales bacterium]|nr:hypothetical protein [Myxococcales bacterium]